VQDRPSLSSSINRREQGDHISSCLSFLLPSPPLSTVRFPPPTAPASPCPFDPTPRQPPMILFLRFDLFKLLSLARQPHYYTVRPVNVDLHKGSLSATLPLYFTKGKGIILITNLICQPWKWTQQFVNNEIFSIAKMFSKR
jgi:hypothetical protein